MKLLAMYILFPVVCFFGFLQYYEYRCESKATKMEVFAFEYTVVEGCMVKDTEDSKWRDVRR